MANRLRLGLQVYAAQRGCRWSEIRDLARFYGGDEDDYGTNVIGLWGAWFLVGRASAK